MCQNIEVSRDEKEPAWSLPPGLKSGGIDEAAPSLPSRLDTPSGL